ncbi:MULTISPECIES: hypothetical protein [Enterobacteriaceae]|uniref:HEAT repeat domain-containing protein n=2 Tax=Kosakonia TaxID=1330547 RepID=A0ABZ0MWP1_9ENTR|nr:MULTISPECIES: hypothetical protein [Enterobacteriaceae]AGN88326.1 hypothetical protein H650_00465 [Enterobacter sp. R4-368]KDE33522.1 hypothetical protein AW40_27090 [Kosakonia radicincitans UMEnt01/12]MDN2488155.1 hypothetical protein [Kosakonia sacchari]NUL39690.1 hypothetical protein [Kosakonia sacchari]PDO82762.1 hypothetical protein BK796_22020 [Kosakonia pseudosacchari]
MQKDQNGAEMKIISSVRHNAMTDACLNDILRENPLYNTSAVVRGAILALHRLDKETRAQLIIEAASH